MICRSVNISFFTNMNRLELLLMRIGVMTMFQLVFLYGKNIEGQSTINLTYLLFHF